MGYQFILTKHLLQYFNFHKSYPNDFSDHIFMKITPIFFVGFSILTTIQRLVLTKIKCASPLEWNECWIEYVNQFCFVEEKYHFSITNGSIYTYKKIDYYQWMPYFFIFLAGISYFPTMVWNISGTFSKIDINHILCIVDSWNNNYQNTESALKYIRNYFHNIYRIKNINNNRNNILWKCDSFFTDKTIFIFYIISKIICILNSIFILFLIKIMIHEHSLWFGYDLLKNLINGVQWETSGSFPRIIMCHIGFGILEEETFQKVQCVLTENTFYEKIVIFIWLWFVFGWVLMIYSGFVWGKFVFQVVSGQYLENYLNKILNEKSDFNKPSTLSLISNDFSHYERLKFQGFKNHYLKLNSMFLLKLIELNFDEIDVEFIIGKLWNEFHEIDSNELKYL